MTTQDDSQPTPKPPKRRQFGGTKPATVSTALHPTPPVAPAPEATRPTLAPAPAPTPEPEAERPSEPRPAAAKPAAKSKPATQRRRPAESRTAPVGHIPYDELPRKECRLRDDQADELTRLARQLSRAARGRRAPGAPVERITDNTLIRVAIDLLLSPENVGRLDGTTEAELRASVGAVTLEV